MISILPRLNNLSFQWPLQWNRALAALAVGILAVLPGCAGHADTLVDTVTEAEQIALVLGLEPGMQVADVGAGDGEWTEEIAQRVGPLGQVFSTEVTEDNVEEIRERIGGAGLDNVTVILGGETATGLKENCCEAILLRRVYHHFTHPAELRADLRRALRPGGVIAVIELPPQTSWSDLEGVPDRGGHGISPEDLVAEMTREGLFEPVRTYDTWPEDRDIDNYCVVFK